MPSAIAAFNAQILLMAFVAGFLAVPIFHQGLYAALYHGGVIPPAKPPAPSNAPWDMTRVPPFSIPRVISSSFWGGVWALVLWPLLSGFSGRILLAGVVLCWRSCTDGRVLLRGDAAQGADDAVQCCQIPGWCCPQWLVGCRHRAHPAHSGGLQLNVTSLDFDTCKTFNWRTTALNRRGSEGAWINHQSSVEPSWVLWLEHCRSSRS